ncbi:MAG: hypothetical protein FWE48_03640 [Coriobacteriia bacterium]|nr:hypothetical protein [Coriobacteriia bacterium]
MANVSDAHGTGAFVGGWTEELQDLFVKVINTSQKDWGYGMEIHYANDEQFSFWGTGRWSFQNTLENLERWTLEECDEKPDLRPLLIELTGEMKAHKLVCRIEFADSEPGGGVLYKMKGDITAAVCDRTNNPTLRWKEISSEDFERTRANLVKLGFEREFEISSDELMTHLSKTKPRGWEKITRAVVDAHLEHNPYAYCIEEEVNELLDPAA